MEINDMGTDKSGKDAKHTAHIRLALLFLLLTVLSASQAYSLGVAPSRQTYMFVPGETLSGEITIINNEGNDFRAGIYADGDLADGVELSENLVDIPATQQTIKIPYKIHLSEKAPLPGDHEIQIVIRQFPRQTEPGTVVAAQLAVIAQVIIKVPYPGKYAEGKLFISDAEKGDVPVTFTVMVLNFGTDNIAEAQAKIGIFGPTWEPIAETQTQMISVAAKQEARLDAIWEPNVSKGSYVAVATVIYDNKVFKIEKPFELGTFAIDINDISVKKFTLGDVAKFDISLYNSWNNKIDGVYVEMIVEDKTGKKMTEFKTTTVDIPAQEQKSVEAYWYTDGVAPDIYKVRVIVHYSGKMTEKDYDFQVETDRIVKIGTEGYATLSSAQKKDVGMQSFVIVLIVIVLTVLIGMNIVWYYVFTRKFKGVEK